MEYLGLFDNSGNPLHKTIVRGNKDFKTGENIKLATIWIKCKDEFLIQKCSIEKGGEFATTGGHVQAGKTSLEQAVLELKEELNLDVEKSQLRFLGNIYRPHAIFDVFILEDDNLKTFKFALQKEEVESVHWLKNGEILELVKDGKLRASSAEQFAKFIQKNS